MLNMLDEFFAVTVLILICNKDTYHLVSVCYQRSNIPPRQYPLQICIGIPSQD